MNLTEIETKWGACTACPGMIGGPVLHEGQPADICFIAEALGKEEVRLGRPLIGPAGQVFNRILAAAEIQRDQVFLMNTVSCRPPNNKIRGFEIENCASIRQALIEACDPKVIVALGATAMRALFPNVKRGITSIRGSILYYKGTPTVITLHPSYVMRMEGFAKSGAESARVVNAMKRSVLNDYLLAQKISQGGCDEQRRKEEKEELQRANT